MSKTYQQDLNVMFTRTCNATCAHCSIESSPRNLRSMSVPVEEATREMIAAFAGWPQARRVVFTGGEPFLQRDRLWSLAAHARANGLRTGVETNGYWASSPERARQAVAASPIDDYMISASNFHSEFIDVDRVVLAYQAAIAGGAQAMIRVAVWSPPSPADEELLALLRERLPEKAIRTSTLVPAGRLLRILPPSARKPGILVEDRCPADGIIVLESGRIDPCCSTLNILGEHALDMGNVTAPGPRDRLAEIDRDPVFASIRDDGLNAVVERLSEVAPDAVAALGTLPEDVCQACAMVMGDPALAPHIRRMRDTVAGND